MQFQKTILLVALGVLFHGAVISMDSKASAYYNAATTAGIHHVKVEAYWNLHNQRISGYMNKINDPNTSEETVSLFAKWLKRERKNNLVVWQFKEQQEKDEWNEDVKLLAVLIESCGSAKNIGNIIVERAYKLEPKYSSKILADEISKDIAAFINK